VRAELVAGADWTAEAAKYSDDPGSKEKGGDLGTIKKGEMVKEFEDAVFSLKKDEISQPVKTAYGYHVIQVTAINEAKQYTLDEVMDPTTDPRTVKEQIKSSLLKAAKSKAWGSWIQKQKTAAGVIYSAEWAPSTTTTTAGAATPTTSGSGGTTTTAAPSSQTTVTPSSTTTTAGATITTAAPTTTTAKP
jgi:parvulin-like peptidyl-prolyl isomerase